MVECHANVLCIMLCLFTSIQRVNQCLQNACHGSNIEGCEKFIDCGHGDDLNEFKTLPTWEQWKNNSDAGACFGVDSFNYGIYQYAVSLTTQKLRTRYVYSLFWGFQVNLQTLLIICIQLEVE